jgi:hypothetical protein
MPLGCTFVGQPEVPCVLVLSEWQRLICSEICRDDGCSMYDKTVEYFMIQKPLKRFCV